MVIKNSGGNPETWEVTKTKEGILKKIETLYKSEGYYEDVTVYNEVCEDIIEKVYMYKEQGIFTYINGEGCEFNYGRFNIEAYLELLYDNVDVLKIKVAYIIIKDGTDSKIYRDSDGVISVDEM